MSTTAATEVDDLVALVRQLTVERIAPRAREIDETASYPWDIRTLLAENDVLALPFDEEHGGTGTGTLALQRCVEEIAKGDASCALILMVQELGSLPISLFGSPEMKRRWLPRFASGELVPAFALSEAEAGSNAAAMRTTARRDGDGWVINGAKAWISNAGVADAYVVFAVTDREAARVTAFLVEADRPGFSIGGYEHKLGIKGSPTGSPVLEDVRVPDANVIGEVGRGMRVALATLERTRLGAAAQAVGIAQGDVGAVPEVVVGGAVPVYEVSLGDDLAGEVRVPRGDAGVDHGDPDPVASGVVPGRAKAGPVEAPLVREPRVPGRVRRLACVVVLDRLDPRLLFELLLRAADLLRSSLRRPRLLRLGHRDDLGVYGLDLLLGLDLRGPDGAVPGPLVGSLLVGDDQTSRRPGDAFACCTVPRRLPPGPGRRGIGDE